MHVFGSLIAKDATVMLREFAQCQEVDGPASILEDELGKNIGKFLTFFSGLI